MGNADTARQL